jgi:hypothetical protein
MTTAVTARWRAVQDSSGMFEALRSLPHAVPNPQRAQLTTVCPPLRSRARR